MNVYRVNSHCNLHCYVGNQIELSLDSAEGAAAQAGAPNVRARSIQARLTIVINQHKPLMSVFEYISTFPYEIRVSEACAGLPRQYNSLGVATKTLPS